MASSGDKLKLKRVLTKLREDLAGVEEMFRLQGADAELIQIREARALLQSLGPEDPRLEEILEIAEAKAVGAIVAYGLRSS